MFPGRKVPAFVELVVMDKFRIRTLCSTPWGLIELVRKGAHGNRDGDIFGAEKGELVFPIETGSGKRRVRQPSDREVVEDIVEREAGRFSGKGRVRSARSSTHRDSSS